MAGKLFDGARGAAFSVADAARHLAWYLSYCVDGSATKACSTDERGSEPALRQAS